MANVRKHDCESVCKDRGLNYLREQNPYVWVLDDFGFTHRFDRSSFVRGSSPSPKSIVGNKTEYSICMIKSKHPEIDHYNVDRETHKVVLSVNEIGKTPYRVVLETKIVKCEKEK